MSPLKQFFVSSTSRRQSVVIVTAQLLMLFAFGAALFVNSWYSFKQVQDAIIDERLTLLTQASKTYLINPSRASEHELESLVLSQSDQACTTLYNTNGEIVSKISYEGYEPSETDMIRYVDIADGNEQLGRLRYIHSPVSSTAWLHNAAVIFLAAILLTAILSPWMIRRINRLSSQPIDAISIAAEDIANSNNFHRRIEITTDDALGRLTRNINTMLEAIEGREAQLTSYGSYLEELVKEKSKQLQALSSEDAMTLCPNRLSLMRNGDKIIKHALEQGNISSVIVIDLLRIKTYNQSYGHHIGDSIIKGVAERLRANFEHVFRIGGDEFCIIIHDAHLAQLEQLARESIEVIEAPLEIDGESVHVLAAAGVSTAPDHGNTITTLLRSANQAMQHSKTLVGSNLTEYSEELFSSVNRQIELERDLSAAIENNELFLVYQPKQHVKSRRIEGVEALARWHHPRLGYVPPLEFVGIAEEAGLARALGNSVLKQAIYQLEKWSELGLQLSIAVNISPAQIMHPEFVNDIKHALSLADVDPTLLELEITESIMIGNHHHIDEAIDRVRDLGVRIAIDDFGTGYSSLSYIRKFTVDTFKLDSTFISDIESSSQSTGIIDALMMLAHTLNLEVVAEGVETASQMLILNTLGCDYIQGNYLSRPVSAEQVEHLSMVINLEADKLEE
jgi:diguanylate cyclase (GGDEF)-like protein